MRAITLLLPLVLASLIALVTILTRAKSRDLPKTNVWPSAHLLILSLLAIIYVACENTVGWHPHWWPRALERTSPLLLNLTSALFCFFILCQCDILPYAQVYLFWLLLKQAPDLRSREIPSAQTYPKARSWKWEERPHRAHHLSPVPEGDEDITSSNVSRRQSEVPHIEVIEPTPTIAGFSSTPKQDEMTEKEAETSSPEQQTSRRPLSDPFSDSHGAPFDTTSFRSSSPSTENECQPVPPPLDSRPRTYIYDTYLEDSPPPSGDACGGLARGSITQDSTSVSEPENPKRISFRASQRMSVTSSAAASFVTAPETRRSALSTPMGTNPNRQSVSTAGYLTAEESHSSDGSWTTIDSSVSSASSARPPVATDGSPRSEGSWVTVSS